MKDPRTGEDEPRTLRVVDWEHPERNDFMAVRQLALQGPLYRCIPDLVLFVNGLPWVVIELKRPERAGAPGVRRQPHELQAPAERRTAAICLQRLADRLQRHR